MTEDERDDLIDRLPKSMVIWNDDDEIQHFAHANSTWWLDALGHSSKSPTHNCCASCGCATTCVAGAFHDALISSVVRELDRLGALKLPPDPGTVTITQARHHHLVAGQCTDRHDTHRLHHTEPVTGCPYKGCHPDA